MAEAEPLLRENRMPTYQYRCNSCGKDLEVFQKFTDASLTVCPTCSGDLRKVFNAVGVVFKGSGFYATDSRKQKSAVSAPAASSSSNSSSSESSSSSGASSTGSSSTGSSSSGSSSSGSSSPAAAGN